MIGDFVNVIDNETMRSVGQGKLIRFNRNQILIETQGVYFRNKRLVHFDARVHHFEGYEPPVMLIKKDGKLVKKGDCC